MKAPIFIFSLPRAGSTLLQKLLMAHSQIASVAEPWFLLPLIYMDRESGVVTEYGHRTSWLAIEDLKANFRHSESLMVKARRSFAKTIYEELCESDEKYFLDKTPRYYLIIEEISKIFPEAKFIFLFRNPLSFFASQINFTSGGKGHLKALPLAKIDLKEGFSKLSAGYRLIKDKSLAIQYESLLEKPEKTINEVLKYLELDEEKSLVSLYKDQDLKGGRGDPYGVKEYKTIDVSSIDKWRETLATPFRRRLARKWVEGLNGDDVALQGYDLERIKDDLRNNKIERYLTTDRLDYLFGRIFVKLRMNLWIPSYSLNAQHKGQYYY